MNREKRKGKRSIPLYVDASSTRSQANTSFGLSLQPLQSPFVLLEERSNLVIAPLVMVLDPPFLFLGQHTFLHHPCLNRYACKPLETEPNIAVKLSSSLKVD